MADKSGREMQTAPVEHAARKENKDMSIAELEAAFGCTADGLSSTQVADLRRLHGYNEIPEEQRSAILKFLSYFWGPIPWMIEAAAVISALVQHWSDLIIVSVLLVVNAVVGFWEEFEAGNAIAALKSRLALSARTLRNGIWSNIPARELVPGDRIRLRLGDIVPADAKILSGDPIDVDQSALTGESLPVSRSIGESVFSGSIIRQGEVDALVYATGQGTFFGKTASLVETTRTTSHFQRAVLKIGNFLILLAIILVAIIVLVALFRGDPFTTTLQFALILTVAAIPVAMPTVLTVTMAVGARILARSKAIVSKLASIEELAGMDTLCSDKTGTLTQNTLTLGDPFTISAVTKEEIITSAALASRAENNDSIDLAILARVNDVARLSTFTTTHFQPFDPVHKRTEATVQDSSGRTFKVSKGAPQVILSISKNGPLVREQTEHAIANFANRGFRALGVARTNDDGDWQFLGVLPLFDPPRVDSKETIHEAVRMGCNIKMITGDQTAIAKETAKQLGLGTDILDASIFSSVNYHQEAHVSDQIEACDGVAQVFPEHKYHIVDTLQKRGHIVGMTGDGVNDAPALKKADVGIAVSGATDAARQQPPSFYWSRDYWPSSMRSRRAERYSSA